MAEFAVEVLAPLPEVIVNPSVSETMFGLGDGLGVGLTLLVTFFVAFFLPAVVALTTELLP